jgi:cell division protein FtsZ
LGSAPESVPVSVLSAPVPDELAPAAGPLADTTPDLADPDTVSAAPYEMPRPEPVLPKYPEYAERAERFTAASDAADSYRAASVEGVARTFDVPTARRRPVVFDEDDDLDVPDFLK